MSDYGVLFSAPMVRALLNTQIGEIAPIDPAKPFKGVTRRLDPTWLKKGKKGNVLWVRETWASPEIDKTKPGRVAYNADGLCGCWVRDADVDRGLSFIAHGRILEAEGYRECFPANGASTYGLGKYSDIRRGEYPSYRYGWRPSIHMFRWASRIRLECLEDAREERLRDISEEDARLEGVAPWHEADLQPDGELRPGPSQKYRAGFMDTWQFLHRAPGERWEDNPTVYRVGRFRRIQ